MSGFAASVDVAFHRAVLNRPTTRSVESDLGPRDRIAALRLLERELRVDRQLADPEGFFPAVPEIEPRRTQVRSPRGSVAEDWRWPSRSPLRFADVEPRWAGHARNLQGHARFVTVPGASRQRPAVILLHGYLAGNPAFEARVWPTRWFLRRGFDVVFPALPFHGARRRDTRPPPFPSADPRFTIEGFRQAMTDLRVLARHLRRRGAPAVGVMGMSLGGYTSALMATVEPLDFVVPFIPLASIADFAKEGGRFTGSEAERAVQHELFERVHAVVSPLARPVQVDPGARLVVGARRDRITPLGHAERIAEHFDAPLSVFDGAHLLQVGRERGFREVARMLGRLGLLR
tara:strand:+ start:5644 stop:6681 length:1038 start_codon:yes stop_codon:yes gene_type:complete